MIRRLLLLGLIGLLWTTPLEAVQLSTEDALGLSRIDLFLRKRQYEQAFEELGKLSKNLQDEPLVQDYLEQAISGLSANPRKRADLKEKAKRRTEISQRLRITRHKIDSDRRSDQDLDSRGWQVNERLQIVTEGKDGYDAKFLVDIDGFKNGHNDIRYRTLLADFFEQPSEYVFEGPDHIAVGDSATFPSYYFMRGSRMRGVNIILTGESHELQALVGAYPFWLESRDEYIYPRRVMGIRDRWKFFEDRFRFGANVINTRDRGRIKTVDIANIPRDNIVYSLDQEIKLIPGVWYVRGYEAYSQTDDDLDQNLQGDQTKLKDTAFRFESRFIQPWLRWNSRVERTGPDFRLLTDIPSGSTTQVKSIPADRFYVDHHLDFKQFGPFDLDIDGSWYRNDLGNRDTVEHTRESWYSANLGIDVPKGWPRPRLRARVVDTVSSPGADTRPAKVRTSNFRGELTHRLWRMRLSGYGTYWTEHALKDDLRRDGTTFEDQIRWTVGGRAAMPLHKRVQLALRYRYESFNELFDEIQENGIRHQTNVNTSMRLWSNASLGFNYTWDHGKLINPDPTIQRLFHTDNHTAGANFIWPYRWMSRDKSRKLSITPSMLFHISDHNDGLGQRPLAVSRLRARYDVLDQWKLEFGYEYRFDKDFDNVFVRTEESRFWMLWSSQWK